MSLGKTRVKATPEQRLLFAVMKENDKLKERIIELGEALEFCKMKMKYNQEFLDRLNKGKEKKV